MTPDDILGLERRRLRSLVERDLSVARALHAPDYQLITPGGATYTRDQYLTAIDTGEIVYTTFEPEDERAAVVKLFADAAAIRYVARIVIAFPGGTDDGRFWHTDLWALGEDGWRATWSQATEAPRRPTPDEDEPATARSGIVRG